MVTPTSNKDTCQSCRGCCKFRADDAYFAPVFTATEVERLRESGAPVDRFQPHKGHVDVFQIKLVPSICDASWLVCPYLDEATHLCSVYAARPTDCRIWPLLIMKDPEGQGTVLGCFNKRICTRTSLLTKIEFDTLVQSMSDWFDREGFARQFKNSPGLAWDHESETFILRRLTPEASIANL